MHLALDNVLLKQNSVRKQVFVSDDSIFPFSNYRTHLNFSRKSIHFPRSLSEENFTAGRFSSGSEDELGK